MYLFDLLKERRANFRRKPFRIPRDYHQEWMDQQRDKQLAWERETLELEDLVRRVRRVQGPEAKTLKISTE